MTRVNVYLTFNGNCEDAFRFYQSVFGGEFGHFSRFGEMPPSEDGQGMPDDQLNRIMHVSLPISIETAIMGSDTGGEWASSFVHGNNFSVSINVDSTAEADRIFNGLSKDGHVTMPLAATFWGSYFGMCTDKFGINWMMSCDVPA